MTIARANPFFVPLLMNRTRRVTLVKNLHHLTKNPIADCPIEGICPQEKYHMAVINAIHHPVDGKGHLLPYLPLPGKEIWDKDPLHVEADDNVLLKQLIPAHSVLLAFVALIPRGNPNNV